ncbi:uncharacterized protein MKZ38_005551 [Zalerion maritima]|uniref:Heterokaryon incompatibility domain-containing protein n=1 Tax=Zalerion maritima TaxID=339359 RepID=A0AAD5WQY4_9PEZI|nr:uncharacterized protein MKZ38_005551 [Zalerion maritima]
MDSLAQELGNFHLVTSPSPSSNPVYTPLPSASHFRILCIEPSGHASSPIRTRLLPVPLHSAPTYSAISYVWGSPSLPSQQITVDNTPVSITPSLFWALSRLRLPEQDRLVWADAVCINQSDISERSSQVAIMNLIYSSADKVLICLGSPSHDHDDSEPGSSELAAEGVATLLGSMSCILDRPEAQDSEAQRQIMRQVNDDVRCRHLGALSAHPWFTRSWVVQEVGLARDPRILWGQQEFSYRLFIRAKTLLFSWEWGLHQRSANLAIHTEWDDWTVAEPRDGNGTKHTFLDLLDHATLLDCTDPRDRVFAFLGHPLAQKKDGTGPVVWPDYAKSTLDVYRDVSMHLLQTEGLRVLRSAEHTEESIAEPFPSWIVRWDIALVNSNISQVVPSPRPSKSGGSDIIFDTYLLRFMGVVVDRVTKSFIIEREGTDFTNTRLRDSSVRWAGDGNRGLGLLDYSHVVQYLQRAGTPCAYATTYRPEEREAAFALTICARKDVDVLPGVSFCKAMRDPSFCSGLAEGSQEYVELLNLVGGFQSASHARTFFVTERGYYGLGPGICRPGDVCTVALGETVPYVLRPVEQDEFEGGLYQYCGEAYVHHMMDGEALEMQRRGVLRPELVSLC